LRCVLLVRKTGFSLISYPCLLSTVPLVPTKKRMGVSGIRSVLVFVHAVRQSHLCCAGCLSFVSASFLCGGAPPLRHLDLSGHFFSYFLGSLSRCSHPCPAHRS
jgi:hypothetical protein